MRAMIFVFARDVHVLLKFFARGKIKWILFEARFEGGP
jgi:hypothetical protein